MKRYVKTSNILFGEKRVIVEEYLRKYCPEYISSKNKDFIINQVVKEFESGNNPFRRISSEYNDSMTQVWESYRRKFMSVAN